ncbi:hypothetical protein ITX31_07535 [Arthrobacter gandavensis]|uniref:hypothetical protein n=1 Tax=Arthrobacter gandavensis TaxID=169960 RepID=UPI00188F4321|nr:hypothetical protein [Arthrobacter gandavensis]MBF4993961.1 hypothetical protein [Arthrobacter gandavensis]
MSKTHPPMPAAMRLATAAWLVAAVVLILAGGSFLFTAQTQRQDSQGLLTLGILGIALGALTAFYALRLRRGKRSSRETLTTLGLIAGVPLLFRGPSLMALGALLLACAVLLWLPQSSRFYAATDPRVRRGRLMGRR